MLGLPVILRAATGLNSRPGMFRRLVISPEEFGFVVLVFLIPLLAFLFWSIFVRTALSARVRAHQMYVFTSHRLITWSPTAITWDVIASAHRVSLQADARSGAIYLGDPPGVFNMVGSAYTAVQRVFGFGDDDPYPSAYELGPEAREVYALVSARHAELRADANPSTLPRTPTAP